MRISLRTKQSILASNSAAVLLPLGSPHPLEWSESTLEEGVIYDIALVVFSRYDPIASLYYALAKIGDYGHGSCAPCCLHQEGPACSVCCHNSSSRPIAADNLIGSSAT